MSLFGSATTATKTNTPPVYTGVQVQTSAQGLPIPIMWGGNRLGGNCISYFNFSKTDANKGKGGKQTQYTYNAAIMVSLCQGATSPTGGQPSVTVGRVWEGGNETTLAGYGGGIFAGGSGQEPWSYAVQFGQDLAYPRLVYYANANADLGSSATIPNLTFEIFCTFNGYHVDNINTHLPDANFGDIIPDFLTNPLYTLNFDGSLLSGFGTGPSDLTTYHLAAGIYVSPILKDQEQVSSILQRWATIGNFWVFWSGTQLVCVTLGDSQINAHGTTYTPNTTPIYDLGPDDFQTSDKNSNKGDALVTVTRKDPADGFNQVQLNCSIRDINGIEYPGSPAYQDTPYRWSDQVSIDHVGIQAPNTISSNEICNSGTAAVCVALIGQRACYVRNDYAFKTLYNFILLLPGDIVTLTDPFIGINKLPVRIKSVEEDDKGILSFTAEEFVYGLGTAMIGEYEPWGGTNPYNTQTPPPSVNAPAIIQAPLSQTQGIQEIWMALSGGENWGGCGVFLSFDDMNYQLIGEVTEGSLQGTLTAALPAATGLDTVDPLSIDLTESLGVIPTGATEANAQALQTLCLVDQELLAYGQVTPTGSYSANLTYLERGAYGTTGAAHSAGAPFARIDPTRVFQYQLPPQYLGATLYFKFPSVNLFQMQPQTLDECVAYEFIPNQLAGPQGFATTYVYTNGTFEGIQCTWGNAQNTAPTSFNFRWSKYPSGTTGQTYGTTTLTATGATSFLISPSALEATGDGFLYVSMQAASGAATSPWTADATLGVAAITSVTTQVTSGGHFEGINVAWTAPSGPTPTGYVVYFVVGANSAGPNGSVGTPGAYSVSGATTSCVIPAATVLTVSGFSQVPVDYTVAVQALYGGASSEWSAGYSVAVWPPLVTSGVSGAAAGTGEVSVSWAAWNGVSAQTSSDGALIPTCYWAYCEIDNDSMSAQRSAALSPTSTSYTFVGLTTGTAYKLTVVTGSNTSNPADTAEVFDAHGFPTLSEQVVAVAG